MSAARISLKPQIAMDKSMRTYDSSTTVTGSSNAQRCHTSEGYSSNTTKSKDDV